MTLAARPGIHTSTAAIGVLQGGAGHHVSTAHDGAQGFDGGRMVAAVTYVNNSQHNIEALSNAVATGLILGLGMGCSFALVLGLTIRAARLSNRERRRLADRPRAQSARPGRRGRARGVAGVDTAGYDPYPPQPYSAHEPASHKPYSRPYRVPAQDPQAARAESNGSRPVGSVGLPNTPWPPTED